MNTVFKSGMIFSLLLMMIAAPAKASGGIALGATRVLSLIHI